MWRARWGRAFVAVWATLLAGAGCGRAATPPVTVSAPAASFATVVQVRISGLPHGRATTVVATARDAHGGVWRSSTQFRSSTTGVVTLSQPALGGSYTGAHAMGVLQFLQPSQPRSAAAFFLPARGFDVDLRVRVDGRERAHALLRRTVPPLATRMLRLPAQNVQGQLFLPQQQGRRPGVLVLGGSEGGRDALTAASLAVEGYPALALAYFGEPGLPRTLRRVPLEYAERALRLLRQTPGVDPDRVVVMGTSRGGELALLLATAYPDLVHAVIAGVPSSVVNPAPPPYAAQPAWTLRGAALPTAPAREFGDTTPSVTDAVIPVERIRGPLLLICGTEDRVWPSCAYASAIENRLRKKQFSFDVRLLRHEGAGHAAAFSAVYLPLSGTTVTAAGGTYAAVQFAAEENQLAVREFLAHLSR